MAVQRKDVEVPDVAARRVLLKDKHTEFIANYGKTNNEFEYGVTEYLRMSGVYWGLTALSLLHELDRMNRDDVIAFVRSCYDDKTGSFSAAPNHDPHLLYTLSAVQILVLYDAMDECDREKVVEYVVGLQQPDGSFIGDKWGEVDTRFSFCALATLSLLGKLDAIRVEDAVKFIVSCMNFDGGFGSVPGSESHAGQIYCCVGALSIVRRLHHVNADMLGWWLAERQLPSGGLNGRPEKLPDVCYSWWVLSSLKIINRLHWIDKDKLAAFILACQDEETGGISDRPGDMVDPFHTLFGVAGLSLLGNKDLKPVNPVFCMPEESLEKIKIKPQLLTE